MPKQRTTTRRWQRRIPGGRLPLYSGLDPAVQRAVDKEARRFQVSRAFVISVCVADSLGVELDEEDKYK